MFRRTICALTAWAALAGRAPAESPEADPPKGKTATAAEPAPPDRKPASPAERPGTAAPAARLGSLSPGVVPTGYRQAKAEPPPSDAPPKCKCAAAEPSAIRNAACSPRSCRASSRKRLPWR